MFTNLAGLGHISLQDMINTVIVESREKIASTEGKPEEKKEEKKDEKVKKLVKYEKKEHGHIPSPKEEEEEKKASAIDFADPDEVEKLASALDQVGEQFIKEAADAVEHGGESKGGGESLPVMKPVAGKQNYGKDSSKAHNVPMTTPSQKGDAGGPAKTQTQNDHAKAPGGAPYPKKGVMKTAGGSVLDQIHAAGKPVEETEVEENVEKLAETDTERAHQYGKSGAKIALIPRAASGAILAGMALHPKTRPIVKASLKGRSAASLAGGVAAGSALDAGLGYGIGRGVHRLKHGPATGKEVEKKSSVDFILGKIANVEKKMGGETLDSKSGEGPKPPSDGTNSARSMIASNEAVTNAKKVQAKAPQKKLMSQVLTEPMMSQAHDHKVSENLRNASKGGVKIAAARALLSKIAAEGCSCEGKGECKHCKMKKAMEKKSMGGGMPMGGSSMSSSMPGSM